MQLYRIKHLSFELNIKKKNSLCKATADFNKFSRHGSSILLFIYLFPSTADYF